MTCGKKTKHTSRIGCCSLCKELFSGDTAVEQHRKRTKGQAATCLDPTEAGLVARDSKTAPGEVIWGFPADEENTRRLNELNHPAALTGAVTTSEEIAS